MTDTIDTTGPHNGVGPALYGHRHPSVKALCSYFDYGHLSQPLQLVSMPFAQNVEKVLHRIPDDSPELTVALRKLLEAKDCAVRAALDSQKAE